MSKPLTPNPDFVTTIEQLRIEDLEQRGNLLFRPNELIATGHVCVCKRRHKWSTWVFAHWYEKIMHNCECGHVTHLYKGRIRESKNE